MLVWKWINQGIDQPFPFEDELYKERRSKMCFLVFILHIISRDFYSPFLPPFLLKRCMHGATTSEARLLAHAFAINMVFKNSSKRAAFPHKHFPHKLVSNLFHPFSRLISLTHMDTITLLFQSSLLACSASSSHIDR